MFVDLARVRITDPCFARWARASQWMMQQLGNGELRPRSGPRLARIFDDGRLRVACQVSSNITLFLTARAGEWCLTE